MKRLRYILYFLCFIMAFPAAALYPDDAVILLPNGNIDKYKGILNEIVISNGLSDSLHGKPHLFFLMESPKSNFWSLVVKNDSVYQAYTGHREVVEHCYKDLAQIYRTPGKNFKGLSPEDLNWVFNELFPNYKDYVFRYYKQDRLPIITVFYFNKDGQLACAMNSDFEFESKKTDKKYTKVIIVLIGLSLGDFL